MLLIRYARTSPQEQSQYLLTRKCAEDNTYSLTGIIPTPETEQTLEIRTLYGISYLIDFILNRYNDIYFLNPIVKLQFKQTMPSTQIKESRWFVR